MSVAKLRTADDLRWQARRLLRQAAELLDRAGAPPHREVWFHHGAEVELFAGTEPLSSRDPEDALEMVFYHLIEQRQRNSEKCTRLAREANATARRQAMKQNVIRGDKQ